MKRQSCFVWLPTLPPASAQRQASVLYVPQSGQTFCGSMQLLKRWLQRQLLGAHIGDEAAELLCAAAYTAPCVSPSPGEYTLLHQINQKCCGSARLLKRWLQRQLLGAHMKRQNCCARLPTPHHVSAQRQVRDFREESMQKLQRCVCTACCNASC